MNDSILKTSPEKLLYFILLVWVTVLLLGVFRLKLHLKTYG